MPRLRALAIVLAALSVLFTLAVILAMYGVLELPAEPHGAFAFGVLAVAFAASLAMAMITRSHWPASRIANIGIAFQFLGALCIALLEESARASASLSVVCVWILSFTLVPQRPVRAVVAAFGAASASLVAYGIDGALGLRDASLSMVVLCSVLAGNVVCATIAVFTNQVMYRLGREAADAKHLGSYVIVEKLGHGGMGEVWRAEPRTLIRPAAIKLIRPESMAGLPPHEVDALRARFEREVQATAQLTSPHTVAVYDFGSTDDGRLYYVMELLHGLDVETIVERHGPLPAERVVHMLRQACASLSEAHAAGLVHRDVKPANLYVCRIGGEVDFVKVLDFGLARNVSSAIRFTHDGAVSGTPAYLAPETAAHNTPDARCDIYALGCVAYWMLTGKLVFEAETGAAMAAAHMRDPVTPPSARTELPIPPELDELVLACLAKDPNARPQTMAELRRLLERIALRMPWSQDRALAWWTLHAPDVLRSAPRARGSVAHAA